MEFNNIGAEECDSSITCQSILDAFVEEYSMNWVGYMSIFDDYPDSDEMLVSLRSYPKTDKTIQKLGCYRSLCSGRCNPKHKQRKWDG